MPLPQARQRFRMNAEQAAGEYREHRKQETSPDWFAADEP
jgi:hypothetical protein